MVIAFGIRPSLNYHVSCSLILILYTIVEILIIFIYHAFILRYKVYHIYSIDQFKF